MTIVSSDRQRKLFGWLRLLAGFGSVQIVIQALGFLSGILIVRHLSKPDYAWFTIANTIASTLNMLADSGVTGAVSAIGGAVLWDKRKFSSLIRTALTFRRKLAVASVLLFTPIFVWMLVRNHASGAIIAVVVPVGLLGFFLQFTANVLGAGIWLRQELRRMQHLGLAPALLRVALLSLACLLFMDVRVAIIVGTIATGLQVLLLRRWERDSIDWHAPVSADYRTRIVGVLKRQAPLTIFYCLQSQLIFWLISVFGSADQVAEIGALGRFAMLFALISSVVNGVVVPRFARCQDPSVLKRRYWQIATSFAFITGSLVTLSAAFPHALLWVLGAKYANLENEVWLLMLTAALSGMFGTLHALAFCKAWIAPAMISIPMEIATQIILILSFDLSTVRGVLLIGCLGSLPPIFLTMIIAQLEMRKSPLPVVSAPAAA